jgi:streptogramin lyase
VRTPGRVHNVTAGPDGNVWFTVQGSGFDFRLRGSGVGRMAPDGTHLETWREPFGGNFVGGVAFDADGVPWGCLREGQSLVRLALGPSSPSALEPFLARSGAMRGARTLAAGPDGSMWVAGDGGIVRVNPLGSRTVFRRGAAGRAQALLPVAGGAVWFAYGGRGIARLASSGSVRRYERGFQPRARPNELALGPDGAVWFIDGARNAIGRMSSTGQVREFARGLGRRRALLTITSGSDRRLWVTDQYGAIDAISTNGRVQRFTHGLGGGAQPTAIANGPDGNLWFTQYVRRRIGRITPAGRVTLWTTRGPPASIAAGPDGALWFTTSSTAKEANFLDALGSYAGVGRITTAGALREFPVRPVESTGYRALAAGPDGKVWFLEDQGPIALARLDPQRLAQLGQLPSG